MYPALLCPRVRPRLSHVDWVPETSQHGGRGACVWALILQQRLLWTGKRAADWGSQALWGVPMLFPHPPPNTSWYLWYSHYRKFLMEKSFPTIQLLGLWLVFWCVLPSLTLSYNILSGCNLIVCTNRNLAFFQLFTQAILHVSAKSANVFSMKNYICWLSKIGQEKNRTISLVSTTRT